MAPERTKEPNAMPWKAIAVVLGVLLIVALICLVLIVTGVMQLGYSLL